MPAPETFKHVWAAPTKLPCVAPAADSPDSEAEPAEATTADGVSEAAQAAPGSSRTVPPRAVGWAFNAESSVFAVRLQDSDAKVRTRRV